MRFHRLRVNGRPKQWPNVRFCVENGVVQTPPNTAHIMYNVCVIIIPEGTCTSQLVPVYCAWQKQMYPLIRSIQVPWLHGLVAHSSMFVSQFVPVNPLLHTNRKKTTRNIQPNIDSKIAIESYANNINYLLYYCCTVNLQLLLLYSGYYNHCLNLLQYLSYLLLAVPIHSFNRNKSLLSQQRWVNWWHYIIILFMITHHKYIHC